MNLEPNATELLRACEALVSALEGRERRTGVPILHPALEQARKAIANARKAREETALTVKRWLRSGELSDSLKTQDKIVEACGRHLDSAYACEILDEVLFEAMDGKFYTVTVEALISEANPDYVKDVLDELEEDVGLDAGR